MDHPQSGTSSDVLFIPARSVHEVFEPLTAIKVKQRPRWLEVLFSLELKNRYDMFNMVGAPALEVREEGSGVLSFLKRTFLGPLRPFTASIRDINGAYVLTLRRPFRFIFHRLEVEDANGRYLGAVQKKWTWFRRLYTIEDERGFERLTLVGPFFKPWTFRVMKEEEEVGVLVKRWSGLFKEMFTDADNFWLNVAEVRNLSERALVIASTVLIDIVHFERRK